MLRWRFASSRPYSRAVSTATRSHGVTINEALRQQRPEQKPKPKPKSKAKHDALATPPPPPWPTHYVSLTELSRSTRSRHLLRAILRECTYLPDPFAGQWTAQYAISRFRRYGFKAWKHRKDESFNDRLIKKEREARQSLTLLKRANEGERKCLVRVLFMAYGRIGRRRHELMVPLLPLRPVIAAKGDEIESAEEAEAAGLERESRTVNLTPQLHALLRSQMKVAPPALTRRNPRRLELVIPELNNWLRPMPQVRIRNMKQKHYADLLDRVLPPLPAEEWRRLRDLASGKTAIEAIKSRRISSSHTPDDLAVGGSALEMVVMHNKIPSKAFDSKEGHTITPRFMRRLYAEILSQCPHMELAAGSADRWVVTWGGRAAAEMGSTLGRSVPDTSSSMEAPT